MMGETIAFFPMLPNELLLSIFKYLAYYELKNQIQYVCMAWNICAKDMIRNRLLETMTFLNKLSTKNSFNVQLRSVFDSFDSEPCSENTIKRPFTAWILGNFEHPAEGQVVTGLEIQLKGFDLKTGMLEFEPTGYASFGMWVDHLGYIAITTPYTWKKFSFSSNISPMLRLWYRCEDPNDSIFIRQVNSISSSPRTSMNLVTKKGIHETILADEIGPVGKISYQMDGISDKNVHNPYSPDQLGGNLLNYFEKEDQKAHGQLLSIFINPQSLIAYPL